MPVTHAALRSLSAADLTTLIKPVVTDESGAPPPENSEVRKIAEDALGALKYSFASVVANPNLPVRPDSVEALFKDGIEAMSQKKRDSYHATAKELVGASTAVRLSMFGRAGQLASDELLGAGGGFARYSEGLSPLAIDRKLLGVRTPRLSVPRGVARTTPEGLLIPSSALPPEFARPDRDFEAVSARAEQSGVFNIERLDDTWGTSYTEDVFSDALADADFEPQAVTNKMGFWVTKVKCVDETNPEWWGHDEIALAGVSVDEDGDTKKISEKYIGGGFDDGDSKSYSNWRYHYFGLWEGDYWPKTYSVTLILAEKDYGGLSSFLNAVWLNVKAKVKEAIENAVKGALTAYLGPVIANAIGKAVAWIIATLIGWIINLFKDDIFPPFTARVTTPSMSARWYYPNGTWGNPSSGLRKAHFWGHGGHYDVTYYWKFFA